MRPLTKKIVFVAATLVAAEPVRRKATEADPAGSDGSGGSGSAPAVTVNCPPHGGPAARAVGRTRRRRRVEVRRVPGGRGPEVPARLRDTPRAGVVSRAAGTDPRQDVRLALRRTKSLMETGEVLYQDYLPTIHRTLLGTTLEGRL